MYYNFLLIKRDGGFPRQHKSFHKIPPFFNKICKYRFLSHARHWGRETVICKVLEENPPGYRQEGW